jgi:hypothetical protein
MALEVNLLRSHIDGRTAPRIEAKLMFVMAPGRELLADGRGTI